MGSRTHIGLATLAFAALAFVAGPARADGAWPNHAVRLIVPYTPGGAADTLGRIAAQKLTETLGQQFVVENRPGAGGLIASQIVAHAAPDGYVLGVSSMTTMVINPSSMDRAHWPLDPFKDFTQIALLGGPPTVLAVDTKLKVKTLKDFIARAKTTPGGFSFGSAGVGSGGQMVMEMLQRLAGFHMTHVPYKGATQATADVMGHQIAAAAVTLSTAGGQIKAGLVHGLAVTTKARVADFPNLPTFAELGYPETTSITWFAMCGPAGLPAAITNKLNAIVVKTFQDPAIQKRLDADAIQTEPYTPAQFLDFVKAETKRWGPIAREAVASAAKANSK